ncbi:hypothetical protein [Salinisphaera sp. G21_0]|uniref:hypothetical protein n=1 Tax=Salinisphaera sp. G21_0 TaxID=2821094 RepID=UPI001AD96EE3|nr:hypothetical protein [Salinisphaera sp. G21_0]
MGSCSSLSIVAETLEREIRGQSIKSRSRQVGGVCPLLEHLPRYVERRLYPGNVWSMDLTGEGPLTLTAADGTALHNMTF